MIVVRADDHVLVSQIGARDDPDHVGAIREGLQVGGVADLARHEPVGQRSQPVDDVVACERGAGRAVVAARRLVPRQLVDVDDRAAAQRRDSKHCHCQPRQQSSSPQVVHRRTIRRGSDRTGISRRPRA